MTLHCVVRLKNSTELFVLKTTWCEGMHSAQVKFYGNRSTRLRTIFYSPNELSQPDFSLDIADEFCSKDTACYKGYVVSTFGE